MGKLYERLRGDVLYHITDFSNLESILSHGGIFSLDEIKKNGLEVHFSSSEASRNKDIEKHLSNYVRLSYTVHYDLVRMMIIKKSLVDPVIIAIDPRIIEEVENVRYTRANATEDDTRLYETEDAVLDGLDFKKICASVSWDNIGDAEYRRARQSEVLIPEKIDIKYIKEIHVGRNVDYSHLEKYGIPFDQENVKGLLEKVIDSPIVKEFDR